jgi:hypothetical protein
MTDYLIVTRAVIILWTNIAVMPAEIFFHAIEAELRRRGVEPQGTDWRSLVAQAVWSGIAI